MRELNMTECQQMAGGFTCPGDFLLGEVLITVVAFVAMIASVSMSFLVES